MILVTVSGQEAVRAFRENAAKSGTSSNQFIKRPRLTTPMFVKRLLREQPKYIRLFPETMLP
jgi:hypothetical protein